MSFLQGIVGWLSLAAALLAPGAIAGAVWTPFLASRRIRSLFVALPPRGSLAPTYVAAAVLASLPYVLGLGAIIATVPSSGAQWSNAIFTLVIFAGVAYTVLVPTVAVVVLPRLGVRWDGAERRVTSWLLLALGGFWYALTFAVPLIFLAFVFALPGGY